MSKIAFFCIPAYGHTNPTVQVVRELTRRGHEVWYFSFTQFKEKIEGAGAKFIPCDEYVADIGVTEEEGAKVALDLGVAIKTLTNTTLALDDIVCRSLREYQPDCVIADSMAVWGRFAAMKLSVPFISSTTTFAFNRYSAKIMKQSASQLFTMLKAMPSVKRDVKRLQANGYPVKNVLSIMSNDNNTNTIVYTSKEFQPCADTFSDRYAFVGPSVPEPQELLEAVTQKTVYVSMGTVNNRMPDFYHNCIAALKDSGYRVILSVGEGTDIAGLGALPDGFIIKSRVDQMAVLQQADVFLSHCGMNSVNESLYCGVPLVLFPQTAEQGGVANRVAQLGAGTFLQENSAKAIRQAVDTVLTNADYQEQAKRIAITFREAGGAAAAADAVEGFIRRARNEIR